MSEITYGGGRNVGKTQRMWAEVERKLSVKDARIAELETENATLRRFCLRAFRVGEWIAGEGFVGGLTEKSEDPDELFMELAAFLGVETDEEVLSALDRLPHF